MGLIPFLSPISIVQQTFVSRDLKSTSMVYTEFISIGGVVFVPALNKACAVTNVIDLNRLLVDDGALNRYTVSVKNVQLTDLSIKISVGARPGTVKKAFAAADLAKGIARKNTRANLTDFDRFKLMRLKQARNRIVKAELGKMSRKK